MKSFAIYLYVFFIAALTPPADLRPNAAAFIASDYVHTCIMYMLCINSQ